MKQLVFDVTDATSIEHSDSVGAFVRAGTDGDLIGSQSLDSQEWLNTASILHSEDGNPINNSNPLAVSVKDGINVEVDLSHVDDSVRLGDGTNFFTSTTVGADIGLDVNLINASIEVTANDLDIRNLTQTDEITVFQGTSPWVIGDGGGSITVDASDLDVRDLTHVSDSIRLGDGTNFLTSTTIGADVGLDVNIINTIAVNDAALANTSIANASNTLNTADTAEDIVASPLANRKYLYIRNMANKNVYIGASGVTAANGFPLSPSAVMELRIGAAVDIEFVGAAGDTPEIRTLELS